MAEIRWYGHNCFRIRAKEATVIVDPVHRSTGYAMGKQNADIVALTNAQPGSRNLAAIRPEFQTVEGPGEYELHDVFLTGIRTYHDGENGKSLGYNTCYVIELEGLTIGHLGSIGHTLSAEQVEALSAVDILMAPAGGGNVLPFEKVVDVVTELTPKVLIPMRYATPIGDKDLGELQPFCKQLGVDIPEAADKLVIRHSELTESMRLVILTPDSEPAKR
jgi:L-ascorbate metabolism protein UlaG (beta-lactamase superfamily)